MGVRPADDSWLVPGSMLLDKYRVESILGKGGMGIVVRCYHPGLDERVAIKILRDDVADPEAAARFLREAQATAKLKSPHVARVHDVGTTAEGMSYMIMELLDGGDIGQMLESQRFEPGDAVGLVLQACEALAEAHAIGIVHRDIKPTNLFVVMQDERPHVKVLDFGISKVAGGMEGIALTQTQSMLGTPAYMSPEQMRSARLVDLRSDVWSIGTVLYEMIEGALPFSAENFSEMVVKVSVDAPTPPTTMTPALAAIVLRCLEKSAERRYSSMLELAHALAPHAHDRAAAQETIDRIARYTGAAAGPLRPVSQPSGSPAWMAEVESGPVVPRDTIASVVHFEPSASRSLSQMPARRWAVRGVIAAVVIGAGVTALMLAGGGASPGGAAPATPSKIQQAQVVAPAPPMPPVPAPAPPPIVTPLPTAPDAGSAAAVADVGSASAAPTPTPPPPPHAGVPPSRRVVHTLPHGSPRPPSGDAAVFTSAHASPKPVTPPPEPPPLPTPAPTPTPTKDCDVFSARKGC